MSKAAPVCHISTNQRIVVQPKPTRLPTVPTPVDLPSAIAAINTLKIIVQQLAGQTPVNGVNGDNASNGAGGPIGGGSFSRPQVFTSSGNGSGANQNNKTKVGRWVEIDRTTSTERIYHTNPDGSKDKEQFIDVKRINALVFQDSVTGEVWIWRR